jgi:hypothetical protein
MNADRDMRAVMVLTRESERMRNAAERVDLVVRAMALRHGVAVGPRKIAEHDIDLMT